MIKYWLDRDEKLWITSDADEGELVLHSSERDAMHLQSTVEKYYGPLVPLTEAVARP